MKSSIEFLHNGESVTLNTLADYQKLARTIVDANSQKAFNTGMMVWSTRKKALDELRGYLEKNDANQTIDELVIKMRNALHKTTESGSMFHDLYLALDSAVKAEHDDLYKKISPLFGRSRFDENDLRSLVSELAIQALTTPSCAQHRSLKAILDTQHTDQELLANAIWDVVQHTEFNFLKDTKQKIMSLLNLLKNIYTIEVGVLSEVSKYQSDWRARTAVSRDCPMVVMLALADPDFKANEVFHNVDYYYLKADEALTRMPRVTMLAIALRCYAYHADKIIHDSLVFRIIQHTREVLGEDHLIEQKNRWNKLVQYILLNDKFSNSINQEISVKSNKNAMPFDLGVISMSWEIVKLLAEKKAIPYGKIREHDSIPTLDIFMHLLCKVKDRSEGDCNKILSVAMDHGLKLRPTLYSSIRFNALLPLNKFVIDMGLNIYNPKHEELIATAVGAAIHEDIRLNNANVTVNKLRLQLNDYCNASFMPNVKQDRVDVQNVFQISYFLMLYAKINKVGDIYWEPVINDLKILLSPLEKYNDIFRIKDEELDEKIEEYSLNMIPEEELAGAFVLKPTHYAETNATGVRGDHKAFVTAIQKRDYEKLPGLMNRFTRLNPNEVVEVPFLPDNVVQRMSLNEFFLMVPEGDNQKSLYEAAKLAFKDKIVEVPCAHHDVGYYHFLVSKIISLGLSKNVDVDKLVKSQKNSFDEHVLLNMLDVLNSCGITFGSDAPWGECFKNISRAFLATAHYKQRYQAIIEVLQKDYFYFDMHENFYAYDNASVSTFLDAHYKHVNMFSLPTLKNTDSDPNSLLVCLVNRQGFFISLCARQNENAAEFLNSLHCLHSGPNHKGAMALFFPFFPQVKKGKLKSFVERYDQGIGLNDDFQGQLTIWEFRFYAYLVQEKISTMALFHGTRYDAYHKLEKVLSQHECTKAELKALILEGLEKYKNDGASKWAVLYGDVTQYTDNSMDDRVTIYANSAPVENVSDPNSNRADPTLNPVIFNFPFPRSTLNTIGSNSNNQCKY